MIPYPVLVAGGEDVAFEIAESLAGLRLLRAAPAGVSVSFVLGETGGELAPGDVLPVGARLSVAAPLELGADTLSLVEFGLPGSGGQPGAVFVNADGFVQVAQGSGVAQAGAGGFVGLGSAAGWQAEQVAGGFVGLTYTPPAEGGGGGLPALGAAGQVLMVVNGAAAWANLPGGGGGGGLPEDGQVGQVLTFSFSGPRWEAAPIELPGQAQPGQVLTWGDNSAPQWQTLTLPAPRPSFAVGVEAGVPAAVQVPAGAVGLVGLRMTGDGRGMVGVYLSSADAQADAARLDAGGGDIPAVPVVGQADLRAVTVAGVFAPVVPGSALYVRCANEAAIGMVFEVLA